ncbi:phosphoribosyltransferase [Azotobacter armeniacus]
MLEHIKTESEITRLELQERAFRRRMYSTQDAVAWAERTAAQYPAMIEQAREQDGVLAEALRRVEKEHEARSVTVEGAAYGTSKEAMAAALAAVERQQGGKPNARYSVQIGGEHVTSKEDIEAAKTSVASGSAAGMTTEQLRAAITCGDVGTMVGRLIDAGRVVIHADASGLPSSLGALPAGVQAATTTDGTIHMVASNLSSGAAPAVLLHEAFHSGGQRLIGSDAWSDLMRRLSALYRQAERSTGKAHEVFDAARSRAAGAAPRLQVEEFGAYAVEEYAALPAAFSRWMDDILGALKAWMLRRFGRQFGRVTPAQLRALAKDALTSVALQGDGRSDGREGGLYSRRGWGQDFPDVVLAHPLSFLNNHPDYSAAKAGDDIAALRVARDAVMPEFVEQVRALIPEGIRPRIVPVLAREQVGDNRIPLAAAKVLAKQLGLRVDTRPIQVEKVGRTQANALERIANQPTFAGQVEPGDYLILDDTLTQGGTLAQLKTHIEGNGGRVLGAVALTGKNYSRKLTLDSSTLAEIRGKYGDIEPWWRDTFGYGFEGLTQSEARTLLTFDKGRLSPDAIRDRLVAAKFRGLGSVDG